MVRQGSKGSGKNAVAGSAVAGGQHDTDEDDAVGLLASSDSQQSSFNARRIPAPPESA
jgi:hypothetical protein